MVVHIFSGNPHIIHNNKSKQFKYYNVSILCINDTLFYNFIVIGVHNFSGNKHIIHNNNCERFKYCTM